LTEESNNDTSHSTGDTESWESN